MPAYSVQSGSRAARRHRGPPNRLTRSGMLCVIACASPSRYIGPFLDRIVDWEKTLNDLQDIMDNWLKMQATWLYLEPIFSSDDIMRQMPVEVYCSSVQLDPRGCLMGVGQDVMRA